MNRKNSTKQPQSGSKLRISTVCRLVILLAVVKAAFLVTVVLTGTTPVQPDFSSVTTIGRSLFTESLGDAPTAADAFVTQAQAVDTRVLAAPAEPTLPATGEAEATLAEAVAPASAQADGADAASTGGEVPMADALALASSDSAIRLPRLLGGSVAYAADLPAIPDVVPSTPAIRGIANSRDLSGTGLVRPDEVAPGENLPTPKVDSFISRDSASQRQAELNRKEQELLALQQQMESRLGELHTLENRLQGMLYEANTTQDSKFKQLVDTYAKMKPRVAAQALISMDESIAVRILAGLKSKESGEIFSYMDPRNAARLSEIMTKMQM